MKEEEREKRRKRTEFKDFVQEQRLGLARE